METLRGNPNLKDLADLLGWARDLVRGEWRKTPHARTVSTMVSCRCSRVAQRTVSS